LLNTLAASQILLVYWVLTYVFPYVTDDARLRAAEAERLRRAAELAQLRANLEPHFLLNTLNAIAGLVSEAPREARRLIVALGELLRNSLDDRDTETVSEQVSWLRHYVAILEARHGDRLRVSWDVDEAARAVVVPRFLLQPLVENAVLHGALSRRAGGTVHVRAELRRTEAGLMLVCEVRDNGTGGLSDEIREGAKGLALVRGRLAAFERRARLWLEPSPPGTRALVELPLSAPGVGRSDQERHVEPSTP
jgi:LytS/YehU family sensor histidine kinase